jgi:tryptophan synthase beta chain
LLRGGRAPHGVAVATVCVRFGLECVAYPGDEDVELQSPNVARTKLLGAEVGPVSSGNRTLKDATSEAIREWVTNAQTAFYIVGSVVSMNPYPKMVRDFQSIIGKATREQIEAAEGRLSTSIVASARERSNAGAIFYPLLEETAYVRLIGVEAAGMKSESEETCSPPSCRVA